jgi:hypothetical protein
MVYLLTKDQHFGAFLKAFEFELFGIVLDRLVYFIVICHIL